ncbi:MAG: ADP-ribosylation factor-like protein [Candidatus Hodarchaeales archaeon]
MAGLSEAGKTAVKRIFFLKQSTDDVNSLSATINYERLAVTVKGTPITIVDLGGQKVFLKRFLNAFSPFVFSNVKIFIFLIDVSNKSTRNNSLQYFSASIEKLKSYSPEAEVFIFLHKNDLVRSSPNYESIHEQLKETFQLEYKSPLRFFRTTIYTPETVIDAFGRIFELAIPKLAESEFVDGRQIGTIEELHETAMILTEPKVKVTANNTTKPLIQITTPKMAGDPEVLQRLQSLMKTATGVKGTIAKPTSIPRMASAVNASKSPIPTAKVFEEVEESLEKIETEIPALADSETILEDQIVEKDEDVKILEDLVSPEISTPPEITEEQILETPTEESFVEQIVYLVDFCGIEPDSATEVVRAGYGELFKIAASSGFPVSTLTEVFLEYIPFVISSQGEEKAKALTGQRLLDIFSAFLKDELDEESIVKCLVFAVERPKMSIDAIIKKYLAEAIKKKREESRRAIKEKGIPVYDGPLFDDSVEGIVLLPGTQDLGYSLDLVDNSRNFKIIIYLRNPKGKYSPIGSSTVSININTDEILYLLAYELNLINLSYYDGGISSMASSAHLIHKDIRQTVEKSGIARTEEPIKGEISKETQFEDLLDFIIPLEIKTDGEFVILPDTEKIGINIVKAKKQGVLINFVQRGYPIGHVNVIENITTAQLSGLLNKAMQLPFESPGAVDFAARMIKLIITDLMRSKEEKYPYSKKKRTEEKSVVQSEKEEEGSDKLMFYLSLLEKEKE